MVAPWSSVRPALYGRIRHTAWAAQKDKGDSMLSLPQDEELILFHMSARFFRMVELDRCEPRFAEAGTEYPIGCFSGLGFRELPCQGTEARGLDT
jgi:hypothetical protein